MCKKKKLDKIGAMLVVARAKAEWSNSWHRRENRIYFCHHCNAWHTTSWK